MEHRLKQKDKNNGVRQLSTAKNAAKRFFAPTFIQPKLTVNAPNDIYEKEADAVADKVMRMPDSASPIQRKCKHCEEEEKLQRKPLATSISPLVQRKLGNEGNAVSSQVTNALQASKGGGKPLPHEARNFMESRFRTDFGHVNIHTDAKAVQLSRDLNAQAFTHGSDVYFNEGKFAPDTAGGKRLLAHELTHVVQQGGTNRIARQAVPQPKPVLQTRGPVIQCAPKCAIDHVKKECDQAGASCQSVQDSYCKKEYPKATDINTLHSNAITGAKGKKKDIPHAAENLLHFLSGSGTEKVMPASIFKNHSATKDQLKDVHRAKFIGGARKRLKDGRLTPGGSVEMVWTDTANAFSFMKEDDLGLSVGGYTLCSKVKVSAKTKSGGDIQITFDQWKVQAFDCYNWDPGKGIGGLFGGVKDSDLCCLENAGKSKHFRIRTDPWDNSHKPSMTSATISASKPPPKPQSPSKSGDDR